MGKTYRFCNLRKWKYFDKKQLTLLKMCSTSPLCSSQADLWPFYGFLSKRFTKAGDSSAAVRWIHWKKTAVNSLQRLQSPPNSTWVTHDSSAFHSWSFFKTHLHRQRIKGRLSLQSYRQNLSLNSALPLKDSAPTWDSNYSHSGWETVSCSRCFLSQGHCYQFVVVVSLSIRRFWGKKGKIEYQAFGPAYCFYCTRVTPISKPIHFISMQEVKKLVCRKTLTHINKENPLFARESKGNPRRGLNFQHISLTLTLTWVFFP